MKFRYIKIDLESQTTATCHAAQPHKIDIVWLQKNPGNLFNHEINIKERQMMLRNERAPSCEQNCWYAEDQAQTSPRILQKGYQRTHDQIDALPEIIDITVGPQCNLTCSYCCKEYSSAWRQDLDHHGPYNLSSEYNDRFSLSSRDRVQMKISQPDLVASTNYNYLLQEIKKTSRNLERLDVTGGEPFLNNTLINLLGDIELSEESTIDIYTGLGVDSNRFARLLDSLSLKSNIQLCVSAENIGPYLEFNRYGITWARFQQNLQSIIDRNIKFRFQSTITNLTAFGFADFVEHYADQKIVMNFAYQPRMQALHVMDDTSKHQLIARFEILPVHFKQRLINNLKLTPTDHDRENMHNFFKQFCARRPNLDASIYPRSFLSWLEN